MNYDEMDYEELEEEKGNLEMELKDINNALEKMQDALKEKTTEGLEKRIEEALKFLANCETDIAQEIYVKLKNKVYNELEQMIDDLDTAKNDLEIDIDDIEYQMAILEDAYDEFAERNSEYWASQF